MSETTTLVEFLEATGVGVRAYDIGRRIGAIPRDTFLAFEQAYLPYPLPMQRKAWVALVQIPAPASVEPLIWFLRLDLDEQGLLVQASRDYLLGRLLESAQTAQAGGDAQAFLQDNPYAFTPRDDRMALFHALLNVDLGLPPSRFYAHALDYFRGTPGWDQWGFVGYQGIADVACRHADEPLSPAIAQLPNEPLVALCHCLESRRLDAGLAGALIERLQRALDDVPVNVPLIAALVRGLSASTELAQVRSALAALLSHPTARAIELLAALSGRAWELLDEPALLQRFLQRLAANDHGQAAFEHCLADLLSLPALGDKVRRSLRDPATGQGVASAFARMVARERGDRPD